MIYYASKRGKEIIWWINIPINLPLKSLIIHSKEKGDPKERKILRAEKTKTKLELLIKIGKKATGLLNKTSVTIGSLKSITNISYAKNSGDLTKFLKLWRFLLALDKLSNAEVTTRKWRKNITTFVIFSYFYVKIIMILRRFYQFYKTWTNMILNK